MDLFVDIDNTIANTEDSNYPASTPKLDAIARINEMYDQGHTITYWTARGQNSGKDWEQLTYQQLKEWGCKYHFLRLDKPSFDLFIDDKAINALILTHKHQQEWLTSLKKHAPSLALKLSAIP